MSNRPHPARALGAPLLVHGEMVGHVSGVFLDADGERPVGAEVTMHDRSTRFVPWVALTTRGERGLVAASAFLLLDSCEPYVELGAVICRDRARLAELGSDVSRVPTVGNAIS